VKFKGAEVMTGRRSTIRQARLWARLLLQAFVLQHLLDARQRPDDVALHMGAPPRWRALFGRTVLRCYRAELARAARAVEQAA
jgi:hypothetical protein